MNASPISLSAWAKAGLYAFAVVLVVSPVVDVGTTVFPFRPGDLSWRYGALGIVPGYIHTPLLGLAIAFCLAIWFRHARTLRWLSILTLLAAVAFVMAMGVFALDVVQMRGMRPPEEQGLVLAGGAIQEFKYGTATLVLALLGIGGWRTAARLLERDADEREAGPGIVSRKG